MKAHSVFSHISSAIFVLASLLTPLPVLAEIKTCTFEKVILRSHHSDNREVCTAMFGESFKIDPAKKIMNIKWPDGSSGWFAPHKITKNDRFTNYILYHEVNVQDVERPRIKKTAICTTSYRLYADGKRAEAHAHVHNFNPRAARYRCK